MEDDSLGNLYAAFENHSGKYKDPMGTDIFIGFIKAAQQIGGVSTEALYGIMTAGYSAPMTPFQAKVICGIGVFVMSPIMIKYGKEQYDSYQASKTIPTWQPGFYHQGLPPGAKSCLGRGTASEQFAGGQSLRTNSTLQMSNESEINRNKNLYADEELDLAVSNATEGTRGKKVKETHSLSNLFEPLKSSDLGRGTIFNHFTNIEGVAGITSLSIEKLKDLKPGQEIIVSSLTFQPGSNSFLAENEGDIFVTDMAYDVSSSKLSGIGISQDKQRFVITFSQEAAFNNDIVVRSTNISRGIFTIPGNTTIKGKFVIRSR